MNWINDSSIWLSGLARPHLATLSVAIVATSLVLAGDSINRFLKRRLGRTPLVLRMLIFSVACTVGYGALTVVAVPFIRHQLAGLSNSLLSPVLMGVFLAIGWIAERKKYI
ncbi:hypothetical protein DSLASN_14120 [Desulfoluna limicola]|uniref:DUF3392 domain-containing protein n=1 Tax=Desulfoluna limicola TaxID=2810562 RepID=A0ABM7PF16_9BACT|nr:DUF3392 family protein [Desulfoluna limicola]BCS95780.1 hypothetical protein DSLASN_14120 [Desulfoluna limicola]